MKSIRKVASALALLAIVAVLSFRHPASRVGEAAVPRVADLPNPTLSTPSSATPQATEATPQPAASKDSEPGLGGFRRWAEQFAQAGPVDRKDLLDEGRKLVNERRRVMSDLIRRDPKAAIDNALPYELRSALPGVIASQIEHPVRGRGDLAVLGVVSENAPLEGDGYRRVASVAGRNYQAFVYGSRVDQITTPNDRLLGVAVDDARDGGLIALRDEPYELLSKAEARDLRLDKAAKGKGDAICAISGDASTSKQDEQAVANGDDVVFFCGVGHVHLWAGGGLDAVGGTVTNPVRSTVIPPTHAQGDKRMLVVRYRFANQASDFEPISDSSLREKMVKIRDEVAEWSYGKLQLEIAFTPTFTAPRTEAEYAAASSPESLMTSDMLALADQYSEGGAFPYNRTNFHFRCMVFESPTVGNGYCGLASVGGVDSWIKCAWSMSVFVHEWGHNFVLKHANQWEPTSNDPIGPGIHRGYGGRYSTMHAWFPTDNPISPPFNTAERWSMGWLGTNEVRFVAVALQQ